MLACSEPTTGGQYHWVSIFAPPRYRTILSYLVGWLCTLGWQSGVAGSANVGALCIQGLIRVVNNRYNPKSWHIVLLTVAILCFVVFFNTVLSRRLPGIEGVIFILYLLGFVAFLIVLFVMGDRSTAEKVFTEFQDNAGWGSIGTACFVSISGPVITVIGSDSAVHLAEELKDASRQLPKAMLCMALTNYFLGFVMLLAFVFVVGNVEEVLASPIGQPFIQVIWNVTQSRGPTVALVAIIIFFFLFTAVNVNTTASRQIWAFARDGGLPFSPWIKYVSPYLHIPVNAVVLSWFIGCCIALVPLGSNAAFLNIQTIGNGGLLSSYILCITCRLYHRNAVSVYGTLPKRPPFCLSKIAGNIINCFALCFLVVFLVAGMFPVAPNPTIETMNWTCMALGATVIIALLLFIPLRKSFLGPGAERLPESEMIHEDVDTALESKTFDDKWS